MFSQKDLFQFDSKIKKRGLARNEKEGGVI